MSSRETPSPIDRVAGGRIGRIVGAFAIAACGAALTRTLGLMAEEIAVRGLGPMIGASGWGALIGVPLASAVVIFFAAAPFATAFAVFAETRRLRGLGPCLAAGALIGPATQASIDLLAGSARPAGLGLHLLAVVAGLVGGWLYWMVAIRAAPPPPPGDLPRSLDPRW